MEKILTKKIHNYKIKMTKKKYIDKQLEYEEFFNENSRLKHNLNKTVY